MTAGVLKLGLIGDNIARSKSPRLHALAGEIVGLEVTYDRLIPADLGIDFDEVFERCRNGGYRGINVTFPYKEYVTARVRIDDPLVAAIAAVNTVRFDDDEALGFNTDYSGFVGAYRETFGEQPPGTVCLLGGGGVGKAVAFGLLALGAEAIHLVDRDPTKAGALAAALEQARPGLRVRFDDAAAKAMAGADGVINCTPVGMVGYEGTPIDAALLADARWAFDAVYTPMDTLFLRDAETAGLAIMGGYELFLHQGAYAFKIFTGRVVDTAALRDALAREAG